MMQQTNDKHNRPAHIVFDYKDVEVLKRFLNPHGKIMSRRRTRLNAADQRNLASAVKRARFMALLPFVLK